MKHGLETVVPPAMGTMTVDGVHHDHLRCDLNAPRCSDQCTVYGLAFARFARTVFLATCRGAIGENNSNWQILGQEIAVFLFLRPRGFGLRPGEERAPSYHPSLGVVTANLLRAGIAEELFCRGFAMERIQGLTGSKLLAALVPRTSLAVSHCRRWRETSLSESSVLSWRWPSSEASLPSAWTIERQGPACGSPVLHPRGLSRRVDLPARALHQPAQKCDEGVRSGLDVQVLPAPRPDVGGGGRYRRPMVPVYCSTDHRHPTLGA